VVAVVVAAQLLALVGQVLSLFDTLILCLRHLRQQVPRRSRYLAVSEHIHSQALDQLRSKVTHGAFC
jgi:hypothetical protein